MAWNNMFQLLGLWEKEFKGFLLTFMKVVDRWNLIFGWRVEYGSWKFGLQICLCTYFICFPLEWVDSQIQRGLVLAKINIPQD